MAYHVVRAEDIEYAERPPAAGEAAPRQAGDITTPAQLKQSRARMWRYPPHTRGKRHQDHVQEEVFVVIAGTLTMLLGDPPERVEGLGPTSVVAVEPMTPLQVRNDGDEELVLYIYGAPPEQAGADTLPDVD
jgi:mannose-6-phosphate isomerase-like protein (cupin superfamily)